MTSSKSSASNAERKAVSISAPSGITPSSRKLEWARITCPMVALFNPEWQLMARLPQPPLSLSDHHITRFNADIVRYLRDTFDKGAKHPGFTQAQIDSFTDRSFLGTLLFNTSSNESNISFLKEGVVTWRPV